jgi:hypothetical protein
MTRTPRHATRFAAHLTVACLLALPAAALAKTAKPTPPVAGTAKQPAAIVDFGIYDVVVAGYTKAPADVAGVRFNARSIKLIRHSHKILAQPSLVFGLRYRITDASLWGRKLRSVIVFPKMTNPKTGKSATVLNSTIYGRSSTDVMLFRFDFSWEMAEGLWFFRIYDGNRVVLEKKFQVIVALN